MLSFDYISIAIGSFFSSASLFLFLFFLFFCSHLIVKQSQFYTRITKQT